MKVKISKYANWIGPYQLVEFFTPIFGEKRIEKFTDGKVFDKFSDIIQPACDWIHSKKKRTEKIHIDRWDSWSGDHTLSLIIVPLLEQLRDTKHGAPITEDEDVPKNLRSTSAPPLTEEELANGGTDELFFQRWDWILNQMIWAFTQIRDDNWEKQFHSGKADLVSKEIEIDGETLFEMELGPNDTAEFDKDGYIAFHKRIVNGTTLFGKYYQNLWD